MKVAIYVEGGGDSNATLSRCRKGFSQFFRKLLPGKAQPKVVACGGRAIAFKDFQKALTARDKDQRILLLVDSEGPVDPKNNEKPWQHLKAREGDGWDKPADALDEDVHLMVQNMEAWFLTHPAALTEHYGKDFKTNRLPKPVNDDIEGISKAKIESGLKSALRETDKKEYDKGTDSFLILERLDPEKVCAASEHAKRLREVLKKLLPERS